MRAGYRFIDHTADVEFIASGESVEAMFKNAFLALFDTISYTKKVSGQDSKAQTFLVKESATELDRMLWYVLQDTVSIAASKELFPYRVDHIRLIKRAKKFGFTAEITAKKQTAKYAKLDVKGISLYDLKISKKGKLFCASVVMDV